MEKERKRLAELEARPSRPLYPVSYHNINTDAMKENERKRLAALDATLQTLTPKELAELRLHAALQGAPEFKESNANAGQIVIERGRALTWTGQCALRPCRQYAMQQSTQ